MKPLLIFLVFCFSTLVVAQPAHTQQKKFTPTTSHSSSSTDSIVVCVPLTGGWNMVSNPVLRAPGTDSLWQVFCSPTRWSCLGFGGGYITCRLATNGQGNWIQEQTPTTCCIAGGEIVLDTVNISTGWNLIGTISHPVAASLVYSIPSNIMVSGFFGFSSGYARVDTLRPGFAYWVKVNQAGRLVISSGF